MITQYTLGPQLLLEMNIKETWVRHSTRLQVIGLGPRSVKYRWLHYPASVKLPLLWDEPDFSILHGSIEPRDCETRLQMLLHMVTK